MSILTEEGMATITEGMTSIMLGAIVRVFSDPVTFLSLVVACCSLIVACCACFVTYKAYKFQKIVAKSSILNIRHQNEIQHLQSMIDTLSQIMLFVFNTMSSRFNEILELKLKLIYHRETIKSMNSYIGQKIDNWMEVKFYDTDMNEVLTMFPKYNHKLDEKYRPFLNKKREKLIDIQDDLFRDLNEAIWN